MHGNDHGHTAVHTHPRYRSDIDGLRSVAVIPVVLFHLGVGLFSGGFIGVDVFFVISGYLITGAIAREVESHRFSILSFYERRCRRILPALFATTLGVLVASFVIFMPDELRDTGASMLGVSSFSSNILFWQQVDYFNGAVELKPLIHTWSLAVEEQFYIVLPLLLMMIGRVAPGRYRFPILTLMLFSFGISILLLWKAPEAGYYLLPGRAWELLLGSCLALDCVPRVRSQAMAGIVATSGLAMVLASAVILTSESAFPGYNALWPCLGAAAFIHANGSHSTLAGQALGSRIPVAFGLISYSLYLVHWPLIVFVNYQLLRPLSATEKISLFVLMICIAALSWRFIERPFRDRSKVSPHAIAILSVTGLILFATIGGALFFYNGLPQRFPGLRLTEAVDGRDVAGPRCFVKDADALWDGDACFLSRALNRPVTLLWGDSHANHYKRAIRDMRPPIKANILLYASAGCLPVLHNTGNPRTYCEATNGRVPNIIRKYGVKRVILSGYWQRTAADTGMPLSDLTDTIIRLHAMGVQVAIIGDNPDFSFKNPQFLAYRLQHSKTPLVSYRMATRNDPKTNMTLKQLVGAANFFDPSSILCTRSGCLAYEHGQTLMTDNAHFSVYGANKVVEAKRSFFEGR
jgi:peptidoglycan/LPS O-acetylase OafA/YrhL